MKISKIMRSHPLWCYLLPIQSAEQCNSYFSTMFVGLIILSVLTLTFDQSAFKWVFIGGLLGSVLSLYAVLPKTFEIQVKEDEAYMFRTKILKKLDSYGYSSQEKQDNQFICKANLNKWLTWNENKFLVTIEGERIFIVGPSFVLRKIHQYLLLLDSDFNFLKNKNK